MTQRTIHNGQPAIDNKDNYEIVYGELLERLKEVDLPGVVPALGGHPHENEFLMRFLGRVYRINPEGILDEKGREPNVATRVILCHYLIQGGDGALTGEWISYRDSKDSAFFIAYFQVNAEERIARTFTGKIHDLERAARELDGRPYEVFQTGDLCYYLEALPRVPLLLVFNDGDDDFPASCKLLFDRSAPVWLDAECRAVLGTLVAERLIRSNR